MQRLLLLLIVPILFSCGRHKPARIITQASGKPHVLIEGLEGDFYKRYSGTIAGKPVVAQLQRWNGILYGNYQYASSGRTITLHVNPNADENADIVLMEQSGDLPQNEQPTWHIQIENQSISGQWQSADGTQQFPILLTENYPAGSIHLNAFFQEDSTLLIAEKPKGARAISTYEYLVPAEVETSTFLTKSIIDCLAPQYSSATNIQEALRRKDEAYFADYRKLNEELYRNMHSEEATFSFNYTNEERLSVLYNDNNWLVTECFIATYTGGAHGNYGSSYLNMDLASQKKWSLTDIVVDTNLLLPALNDAALLYFQLKPGEDVGSRMLVQQVPITSNFFLSGRGITFVYNPYEIASYADGQVALFLSYSSILHNLTPAFIERMRLAENAGVAGL
ncbi:MAG: DUF3298 domain-containing protein [Chitinophagaceae bacterium]